MTKRCFVDSDCVEAVESVQRRASDRRAHSDRRGTNDCSMVSPQPRLYGFRTFDDRRSQSDRRSHGQRMAETARVDAAAVTAGCESRKPPETSGEIRVLSVRRLSGKAKARESSVASSRGLILDWEG